MNEIKTGSYVGNGAAINIALGWQPAYIKVWNETDGNQAWKYFAGMTDGHALQTVNSASTQLSRITSGGISRFAGAPFTTPEGFTVGTTLSTAGKTYRYVAVRAGSGAQ